MDLLYAAWRILPALYDHKIREINAGLRPATRDGLPLIGKSAVAGLFLATGHFRHGVLLAPVTAVCLADLIETGRYPALIEPFDPALRLGTGSSQEVAR